MLGRNKERESAPASVEGAVPHAGGKGRPTPKRSEAQRGRRRSAAPKDRKEAYRQMRQEQRAARVKSMEALRTGDERNLPLRDRGPVRRYARDFVDARRSVAEFFLPVALLILVLSVLGGAIDSAALSFVSSSLWMLIVILIIVDSIVLVTRLKRGLKRTHPDESSKGAVAYALMRSMQIRRFRLPAPRIRPGRRRR